MTKYIHAYLNDFCASPRNSAIGRNVEGISDDKKVKKLSLVSILLIKGQSCDGKGRKSLSSKLEPYESFNLDG